MKYRAIQNRQLTDKSRSVPKYVAHKPRFLRWNTLRREMEHAPPGDGTRSVGRWNEPLEKPKHFAPDPAQSSVNKNSAKANVSYPLPHLTRREARRRARAPSPRPFRQG